MFEIGNSLREARLRQGLDLAEIEQATKIRNRYLRALEDEQFDVLPAQTYVKGFLKAYADQLGLDGDLYVEEFNSRYATDEEPVQPGRGGGGGGGGSWPGPVRLQSSAVLIALTAIGLATALVIVAWRFGATEPAEDIPGLPPASEAAKPATKTQRQRSQTVASNRQVRLVASAVRGRCWLEIHRGSETGELLYQGTLEQGRSTAPFRGNRLWVAVGAPANVVIRVNGRRRSLPPGSTVPRELIVNRSGVTAART